MHDDTDSKLHGSLLESLEIKQADHYNLPLIKQLYKNNGMRPQAPKGDLIYVATLNHSIVAALRLHPVKADYLLRSMCVSAELRQQGIGSALLMHLQEILSRLSCYSFPYTHLQNFYAQASFILCEPESAPEAIAGKFKLYLKKGKKICLMKHQAESMLK